MLVSLLSRSSTVPLTDDVTAVLARARADVDHPVGGPDRVLVVLDDDERVAEVAQPQQRVEQLLVVPLVQADRRLVEHVEHADQAGADLGGEPDPLRLAAGQGRARPVERQVVEAHVEQEAEAGVDLLEDEPRDRHVALGQLQVEQVLGQLADRLGAVGGDRLVVDRDRERDRLEARALAGRAGHLAHEARELLPARVRLGLGVAALHVGDRALEVRVVGPLAAVAVLVPDVDLLVQAVQQRLLAPWRAAAPTGCRCGTRRSRPGPRSAGRSSRSRARPPTGRSRPRPGTWPGRGR